MRPNVELDLLFHPDRTRMFSHLAMLDEREGSFLSCYLDAQAGREACKDFLNQKAAYIRSTLTGTARFDFENAVAMIFRELEVNWHPDARGLAVFARGVAGGRHLTVLPFATRVDNRLILYRVPEVLPLVALLQREPAFSLLLVRGGRATLLDVPALRATAGTSVIEAVEWGPLSGPETQSPADATPSSVTDTTRSGQWHLRKAMVESTTPLFIAGDILSLQAIAGRLPQRVVERLVGTLPVADEASIDEVLRVARERLGAICAEASAKLVSAVSTTGNAQSDAVVGYRATLGELRRGGLHTLVIADWDHPGLGLPWEDEIELCHEALRQGIRLVLAESVGLRHAGGVGGLVGERGHSTHSAGAVRRQVSGLERVA